MVCFGTAALAGGAVGPMMAKVAASAAAELSTARWRSRRVSAPMADSLSEPARFRMRECVRHLCTMVASGQSCRASGGLRPAEGDVRGSSGLLTLTGVYVSLGWGPPGVNLE